MRVLRLCCSIVARRTPPRQRAMIARPRVPILMASCGITHAGAPIGPNTRSCEEIGVGPMGETVVRVTPGEPRAWLPDELLDRGYNVRRVDARCFEQLVGRARTGHLVNAKLGDMRLHRRGRLRLRPTEGLEHGIA